MLIITSDDCLTLAAGCGALMERGGYVVALMLISSQMLGKRVRNGPRFFCVGVLWPDMVGAGRRGGGGDYLSQQGSITEAMIFKALLT